VTVSSAPASWRSALLLVSLALLLVTSVPYAYGFLTAPADRWFSGVIYNVNDTAQYFSWMRESGTRLLIENRLTHEPNPPLFLNLHWWIPGRAGALLGLSPPQSYQLLRLVVIPLYVVATYWICGLFFRVAAERWFAFALTTMTSGLGWIWVVDKYLFRRADVRWPQDLYTTPGNSFWVLLASPHLALALALTLLVFGLAWLAEQRRSRGLSLLAGAAALFLGLGHVYDLVTVWSVLSAFTVLVILRDGFDRGAMARTLTLVLLSAPAPLYFGWLSAANSQWREALAQYDNLGVFTPSPVHLFVLLGLSLPLAATEAALKLRAALGAGGLRHLSRRDLFLCTWLAVNLVVIYLPLKFQIMLLTGIQFPLAGLVTDLVFRRSRPEPGEVSPRRAHPPEGRRSEAGLARWIPAAVLLAVLPTNLYLFAWRLVDLRRHDYPFYLRADDREAMRWLEANAGRDAVVLSAFVTGHYIPGLTGARGFLTNAVMTLDFNRKRRLVQDFFRNGHMDEGRRALLSDIGVDYVFHGAAERALGSFDPAANTDLHPVFESPSTRIFGVVPGR
jgi:hypothetical protein